MSLKGSQRRRLQERSIKFLFLLCGLVSIGTTAGIILTLVVETYHFFAHPDVSVVDYLTGTVWTPLFASKSFGVLPLVSATLLITAVAMAVAIPLGLMSAIYLAEYASERVRNTAKPMLEILAGIPTVVYGYFALFFVTPLLQKFIPGVNVFNALSAGLVMGIMIVPLVASLSEDALSAVPRSLREAGYALGATKLEVSTQVVVPAALSGIVAALILAVSRAVGETMIVAIAAGQRPQLTLDLRQPMETMTAYIVQISLGDTPTGTLAYQTLFAVGFTLFLMTLGLNMVSEVMRRKFREVYE